MHSTDFKKASGPDIISFVVLKNICHELSWNIAKLFNRCPKYFPSCQLRFQETWLAFTPARNVLAYLLSPAHYFSQQGSSLSTFKESDVDEQYEVRYSCSKTDVPLTRRICETIHIWLHHEISQRPLTSCCMGVLI